MRNAKMANTKDLKDQKLKKIKSGLNLKQNRIKRREIKIKRTLFLVKMEF